MDHPQYGISNSGPELPVAVPDEPLDDVPASAHRLAGVGAALGSCFSVMIVVLVISGAGTVSGPRTGLAAEDADGTAADSSSTSSEAVSKPSGVAAAAVSFEDRQRIESLERAAMLARAEVEAAETRVAMARSSVERRALERAEQQRQSAEQVESNGSPYEWMTAEQLASRTRDRARQQLDADLGALRSIQTSAEGELAWLRDAADAAERALTEAKRELAARMTRNEPATKTEAATRPAPPVSAVHPTSTIDADLTNLIARHHARLIGSPSDPQPRD